MKVLVVDDEPHIRRALRSGLQALGQQVTAVGDGAGALAAVAGELFDVVILDLGLPDQGGIEVIRRMRSWTTVPVVVLSVRADQDDKISALDAGADDYVEKPFAMGELVARMGAVVRRSATQPVDAILTFGSLVVDQPQQLVTLNGERLAVTPTEYRLLIALTTNPAKLLTHQWLLRHVWGPGYQTESQYLRAYVRRLRAKLGDDPTDARWIATEPGIGYRWIAVKDQG